MANQKKENPGKEAEENTYSDIENLKIRVEKLKKHLSTHKHDNTTKRALLIKEAKLKKLEKYRK